jgi:hypothetical protein
MEVLRWVVVALAAVVLAVQAVRLQAERRRGEPLTWAAAFDVLPLLFMIAAYALHHKPWMQLSLAFWGFTLLQEAWNWRGVFRKPTAADHPPAASFTRADTAFAAVSVVLVGVAVWYVLWVPDSACYFCIRNVVRA